MPNVKDYQASNIRVLALGEPGGGKTFSFSCLPGPKFMFVFEPNTLECLHGQDIEYELFLPDELDFSVATLKKGVRDQSAKGSFEPKAYIDFESIFWDMKNRNEFSQYEWIGFDSMTTFQEITMDRHLFLNGRFNKHPEFADNTGCKNTVLAAMRTLCAITDCNIYVTAHIGMRADETTGRTFNQINVLGQLRQYLPGMFSEIWRFYGDVDEKELSHYYVQTKPDNRNPFLRTTRKLSLIEEVTVVPGPREGQGIAKLLEKERV